MKEVLMYLTMCRSGQKASIGSRIAAMVLLMLCSIGIIVGGMKSGYMEWVIIGMVWAIVNAIIIAILIFINIRRNTRRW